MLAERDKLNADSQDVLDKLTEAAHGVDTLRNSMMLASPLKQMHVRAMRAQRDLDFHLSASFLCRKPQFNEPPEGLRPRRQVFLLSAPSVDALNHCSL
jgi:hypothetical protein